MIANVLPLRPSPWKFYVVGATSLLTRLLRNSVKCCDKTVAQCYGRWEWFMNDAQYGNSNLFRYGN